MTYRIRGWVVDPVHRPLLYAAMVIVAIAGSAVAFGVHERQVERHARNQAIALAITVQHRADVKASDAIYQSALRQCRRGRSVRAATRANALVSQKVYRVLRGFLKGARPRAFAQSQDPNISARSRLGAKRSLLSIDNGIAVLSVRLTIPPPPPRCVDVITNPNAPPALQHHR